MKKVNEDLTKIIFTAIDNIDERSALIQIYIYCGKRYAQLEINGMTKDMQYQSEAMLDNLTEEDGDDS